MCDGLWQGRDAFVLLYAIYSYLFGECTGVNKVVTLPFLHSSNTK